jgi:1,4-dihydroxy-2-naphthoyl-CoA hydrolase
MHGGALISLADSVGAICAFLNLPAEARTATTNSSTTPLRAVRGGTVTATGRPLHVGRTSIVVQTEITDEAGRLVAQTTQIARGARLGLG